MPRPLPLWPCNKVLKPNFQSIISQTYNECSLLSLILTKLLLLDIPVSCENIFALSTVTSGELRGGGGRAERAEARGPSTFRGLTNFHFSKSFFFDKKCFRFQIRSSLAETSKVF